MAEYWVHATDGDEANAGTSEGAPWQRIPGQTGSHTVAADSIVNIRTGLDYSAWGRLLPPGDRIRYRGYGMASNVLTLDKLPLGSRRVVREAGVHEGMWIINNDPYVAALAGLIHTVARSGTIIEDFCGDVGDGSTPGKLSVGIIFGSSTSTMSGATIRRSWVKGSHYGIQGYTNSIVIDECRVEDTAIDGIFLQSAVGTSYRLNGVDAITNTEIINPGWDEVTAEGDGIQNSPTYLAKLTISNVYIEKPSTSKQGMILCDATAGLSVSDVVINGMGTGAGQVCITGAKGVMDFRRMRFDDAVASNGNPLFRCLPASAGTPALDTGSVVMIDGIEAIGDYANGIFGWNGTTLAGVTVDGKVYVQNVYMQGDGNATPLSYSGLFTTVDTASVTAGANAELHVSNVTYNGTPNIPIARIPTGMEASSSYTFTNVLAPAGSWYIGSTEYATLALFAVAKTVGLSTCRELVDGDLDDAGRPKSAIKYIGTHNGYCNDPTGRLRHNPPTVGAYEFFDPAA